MLYNIPYHKISSIKQSQDKTEILDLVSKLFFYLQVDQQAQKEEIKKAFSRQKHFNTLVDYYRSIIDVLIGSLYENDVATVLQSYQLNPQFSNTVGQVINLTSYSKMKNADIIVTSLKNNLIYGFDVKFGTLWRQSSNTKHIYVTNSGLTENKLKEIYDDFKYKLKQQYGSSFHKVYLLLVCYDMLSQVNYLGQSILYQSVFNQLPNRIDKVMFVVDIEKLFYSLIDEGLTGYAFDSHSPYLIDNYKATGKDYYATSHGHQYSIKINSDIAVTLEQFIKNELILTEIEQW